MAKGKDAVRAWKAEEETRKAAEQAEADAADLVENIGAMLEKPEQAPELTNTTESAEPVDHSSLLCAEIVGISRGSDQ